MLFNFNLGNSKSSLSAERKQEVTFLKPLSSHHITSKGEPVVRSWTNTWSERWSRAGHAHTVRRFQVSMSHRLVRGVDRYRNANRFGTDQWTTLGTESANLTATASASWPTCSARVGGPGRAALVFTILNTILSRAETFKQLVIFQYLTLLSQLTSPATDILIKNRFLTRFRAYLREYTAGITRNEQILDSFVVSGINFKSLRAEIIWHLAL